MTTNNNKKKNRKMGKDYELSVHRKGVQIIL